MAAKLSVQTALFTTLYRCISSWKWSENVGGGGSLRMSDCGESKEITPVYCGKHGIVKLQSRWMNYPMESLAHHLQKKWQKSK